MEFVRSTNFWRRVFICSLVSLGCMRLSFDAFGPSRAILHIIRDFVYLEGELFFGPADVCRKQREYYFRESLFTPVPTEATVAHSLRHRDKVAYKIMEQIYYFSRPILFFK
jgi:hypothetical protein